jgi:hypothetical protein
MNMNFSISTVGLWAFSALTFVGVISAVMRWKTIFTYFRIPYALVGLVAFLHVINHASFTWIAAALTLYVAPAIALDFWHKNRIHAKARKPVFWTAIFMLVVGFASLLHQVGGSWTQAVTIVAVLVAVFGFILKPIIDLSVLKRKAELAAPIRKMKPLNGLFPPHPVILFVAALMVGVVVMFHRLGGSWWQAGRCVAIAAMIIASVALIVRRKARRGGPPNVSSGAYIPAPVSVVSGLDEASRRSQLTDRLKEMRTWMEKLEDKGHSAWAEAARVDNDPKLACAAQPSFSAHLKEQMVGWIAQRIEPAKELARSLGDQETLASIEDIWRRLAPHQIALCGQA